MDNRELVLAKIDEVLRVLGDVITPHENIMADDDQYEDPELWWAYPARALLLEAAAKVKGT